MKILRNTEKQLPWTKENVEKYKAGNNLLRHARVGKNVSGIILIDKNTDTLIGYVAWIDDYIIALEVVKEYQEHGYGRKLLEKAIKNGCTKLSVNKNNIPAIKLYEKVGFKKNKDLNYMMIEMSLSKF